MSSEVGFRWIVPTVQGATSVLTEPLIDTRDANQPAVHQSWRRQLVGGLTLAGLLAILFFIGFTERGASQAALLTVLGGFAALGIAALLALVLGFLRVLDRKPEPSWADRFMDEDMQAVLCTSPNGQIIYANQAYGLLTGEQDPQQLKLPDRVFGIEADAADTMFQLLRTVSEGKIGEADVRLSRGADGTLSPRWYHVSARPMGALVSQDNVDEGTDRAAQQGVVWRIADVTAERARQEQVFQDLQQAVDYLDHAPAGFFSSDPEGTINYMNATLAAWLGYDLAVIDQAGLELDDLLAGDGAALLAASPTTTDFDGLATIADVDLLRRDGARIPARIHHRVPLSAEGDARASRTLVINRSSGFDVDESVRAAEVKFARFFNNAPIAIAVVNSDGDLVQMNAPFASLFPEHADDAGRLSVGTEEGASATRFVELFSWDVQEAVQQALDDAAAERGRMRPVDVIIGPQNQDDMVGTQVEFVGRDSGQISAQLFVSAVGDDREALVFLIDTSEQKALEQQFAQTQKMMAFGQLAGGVAHDFNNMLQAIMGNVDLLMLNHPPSDPSYRYISPIRQNCNRAAALVRHLLAFSRKQTLRPQVLHMDDVLSDLSMTVDRLVGETVKLDVDISGEVWPVMADLTQLENVLINLAVNARDAMPEGGQLTMTTRNVMQEETASFDFKGLETADYVLVSVSDTGTGIPPEIMEKIFEPFFTTKDVGKGTGLGLATVYGTIKQTGGYVYPDSTVGEGTTFHIFLPRYRGAQVPEEAAQTQNQPQEDLTGAASVLLVEDDEGVRMVNATLLRSGGYTVYEAGSGVEALEVLDEQGDEIQLIVSDVVMPEMDGPTLLQEARELYPDIRFIFVSGYAEDAFAKNLPEDQEFTFLAKPFSMKDFAETVKRVLAS